MRKPEIMISKQNRKDDNMSPLYDFVVFLTYGKQPIMCVDFKTGEELFFGICDGIPEDLLNRKLFKVTSGKEYLIAVLK